MALTRIAALGSIASTATAEVERRHRVRPREVVELRLERGTVAAPAVDEEQFGLAADGRSLEVDTHHDSTDARLADLGEPGGGEHPSGADVQLSEESVLRRHRVALDCTGTALPGELGGLTR